MTTPTLYSYPIAFNPAKAKLALEEHGIKFTEKKIEIFSGESLEPWYLKLNPQSSAPTLVAGETVIPESAEIIKWADQQEGGPLGGDNVDREFIADWISKVDAWNGNIYAGVYSSAGGILKSTSEYKIKVAESYAKKYPDMAETYTSKVTSMKGMLADISDKSVGEANKAQLVSLLDEAEERLSKTKYLAGDEYSSADVIFTPVVYRITLAKMEKELLEPRAKLSAYWTELKKRPSYKKTFGVSDSGLQTMSTVLPTLVKIKVSSLFGKY